MSKKWESINVYRLNLELDKETQVPVEAAVHKPEDAKDIVNLVLDLNNSAVEKFGFIAFDKYRKVIGVHITAVGRCNSVQVDETEFFVTAAFYRAHGIILFHNHPGESVEPSMSDIIFTQKLIDRGVDFSIPVYDHIIVGRENYYSMFENDDCEFPPPKMGIPVSDIWT